MGGHLCDWFCNSCCLLKDIPKNRPQSCILKMKAIGQKYLSQKRELDYIFFLPWIACSSQLVEWLEEMKKGEIDGIHMLVCSIKAIFYPEQMGSVGSNSNIWPKYSPREKMIMLIMPAWGWGRWKQEHQKKHNQIAQGCYFRLPVAQAPCPWNRDAAITIISQITCILEVNIKKKKK